MADKTKIIKDWSNADQFLRERYEPTKKYVDNQINPEFVYDETAVSCKTVPQDVGDFAIVSTIYGGTQKVVQLLNTKTSQAVVGTNFATDSNGVVTITGTGSGSGGRTTTVLNNEFDIVNGHKYYLVIPKDSGSTIYWFIQKSDGTSLAMLGGSNSKMYTASENSTNAFLGYNVSANTYNSKGYLMMFDLTAMYGTGKEPTEEECESIFINFIAYTTGSLWNSPIESVVSFPKNLFDGVYKVGYIASTTYNFSNSDANTRTALINCKSNTTYTIVIDDESNSDRFRIASYTGTTSNPISISSSGISYHETTNKRKCTYTTASNATALGVYVSGSGKEPHLRIMEGNTDNKTTISVPDSIKNLEGYGLGISDTVRNYVDFETGKYYKYCKPIKISDLTWVYSINSERHFFRSNVLSYIKVVDNSKTPNLMAAGYNTVPSSATWKTGDISQNSSSTTSTTIYIVDNTFDSTAEFLNAIGDEIIVVELATPEVIDISDIIRPIKCETGGTITLVNEHNLDVANTIIYEREVL